MQDKGTVNNSQKDNSGVSNRRVSSDTTTNTLTSSSTSRSDSFLLRQEKSTASLDTLDTDTDSNSGLSTVQSGTDLKEQGSEDSLIRHTTNNLNVSENTPNGDLNNSKLVSEFSELTSNLAMISFCLFFPVVME